MAGRVLANSWNRREGDTKAGAKESGTEFLARIGLAAEALAELAIAAALVACRVGRLMTDEPTPRIPLLQKDSGANQTIPSSRHKEQQCSGMSAYASGAAGQRTLIEDRHLRHRTKPLAR